MLSLFKIRNFKSILDMTVDLRYNEGKAPNNWQDLPKLPFLEAGKDNRFIPALALFGANASGKSNVIEAFLMLNNMIRNAIDLNSAYRPNRLNQKYDFTEFEIEFFVEKTKFNYLLKYNAKQIISEKLTKNDNIVFHISLDQKIFDVSGIETGSYKSDVFKEFFDIELARKMMLGSQVQIKTFFEAAFKRFPGIQDLSVVEYLLNSVLIAPSTQFAENWKHLGAIPLSDITAFIKKFDIDINEIQIREMPQGGAAIKTIHKDINNKNIEMDLRAEESRGTNLLFGIIELFLIALRGGYTLIIDELDCSLHPLILTKIVELFKDKDYNKNNAQLIFTCHSTDILENQTLRISEVAIIEKTLKDGSTIKRLSDFEGLRNTYDFRKMYLDGNFGGIPFPYI